jgi:hypothetical protein
MIERQRTPERIRELFHLAHNEQNTFIRDSSKYQAFLWNAGIKNNVRGLELLPRVGH